MISLFELYILTLELRGEFNKFDLDGNGAISLKELRTVMIQMGMNPSEADVKEMIAAHDKDGESG